MGACSSESTETYIDGSPHHPPVQPGSQNGFLKPSKMLGEKLAIKQPKRLSDTWAKHPCFQAGEGSLWDEIGTAGVVCHD